MTNPFDDLKRKHDLERQKADDRKRQYWQTIEAKHKYRTQLWKQYDSVVTDVLRQLQVSLLPNHKVDSRPPQSLREFRQYWEELLGSKQSFFREGAFYVSPLLKPWLVIHKNRNRDDDEKLLRGSFYLYVHIETDVNDNPLQFKCGYFGKSGEQEIEKTTSCGLSQGELIQGLRELMQNLRFV